MLEMLKKMRALDAEWYSGRKIDCPEELRGYLKGIVLNDLARDEKDLTMKRILTEEAIQSVRGRLANAPQGEELYLKLVCKTLMDELKWYNGDGGCLMDGLRYKLLLDHGRKHYNW